MGLFSRKNNKNNEKEALVAENSGQKKVLKNKQSLAVGNGKDFKDLASDNKKSRREPKKPWGKTERYMVLVVIILTAGISVCLRVVSTGWELPKLQMQRFEIPAVFTEETIILENDKEF